MPNGFKGRPAARYLNEVSQAQAQAINSTRRSPVRIPPDLTNPQLPYTPTEADTGSFTTNKRSSSNIVADQREYEDISRRISQTDDKIGQCLYHIAKEIEDMCQTSYKLPWATPRCLNITDNIKSSISEFRSVTEEAVSQIRSYARDITEIDGN